MRALIFSVFLLITACDYRDKPVCVNPPHVFSKWEDVENGTSSSGVPAIKQVRHCEKCGYGQVEWH